MKNWGKKTLFTAGSAVVSAGLPVWAMVEKFPTWFQTQGAGKTCAVGIFVAAIISIITLRKQIVSAWKNHVGNKLSKPIFFWGIILGLLIGIRAFAVFVPDLITVAVAGCIGSGLGIAVDAVGNVVTTNNNETSESQQKGL